LNFTFNIITHIKNVNISNNLVQTIIMEVINGGLTDILSPIAEFIDDNICDKRMKAQLSRLNNGDNEKLLSILCGQKSVTASFPYYSLYKYNITTNKFSHHLDVTDDSGDQHSITVQYDHNHFILHILSIESFMFYLSDSSEINDTSRYIFLNVSLSSENREAGHRTCLIIDKQRAESYLYDPNGETTFFNNIFAEEATKCGVEYTNDLYFDGHTAINKLFEGYFGDLKERLGTTLKFVPSNIWNPNRYVLNPSFSSNVLIGSGHCVITTIMLIHILHLTQENLSTIFKELGKLSKDLLIYTINGYSCSIHNLMKDTFDKYMENTNYRKHIEKDMITDYL